MLKNRNGFTVIELIMSFLFASILAITLFSVVVTYRNKHTDSSIESELIAFKSHLIMDVQSDIQLKGLKEIHYCPPTQEELDNGIKNHPRCVVMSFNDESVKTFELKSDQKVDIIENADGTNSQFNYSIPYIVYGDIRYDIPDATSVFIDDEYILQTASLYDGLETRTKLYKIDFNLKHSDLDTNINIAIVANGTLADNTIEGDFNEYRIGDRVSVQLNDLYQQSFRVIQNSSKTKDDLVLLYDPAPQKDDSCEVIGDGYIVRKRGNSSETIDLNSVEYNLKGNYANKYEGSIIKNKVRELELAWNNTEEVKLITTEDIARIAAFCPQYRGVDSPDVSLLSTPEWLTSKNYWTMSDKIVTGDNNGKKVWYVNGSTKTLTNDFVDESYTLRPVIVIKKKYVTFDYPGSSVPICPYG